YRARRAPSDFLWVAVSPLNVPKGDLITAISARCRGYFVGRCLEGRRLGRIVLPRPGGLGGFRRCFGGSAASENGASMGWQACLRGVKNETRCDAGADRCTISTAGGCRVNGSGSVRWV